MQTGVQGKSMAWHVIARAGLGYGEAIPLYGLNVDPLASIDGSLGH